MSTHNVHVCFHPEIRKILLLFGQKSTLSGVMHGTPCIWSYVNISDGGVPQLVPPHLPQVPEIITHRLTEPCREPFMLTEVVGRGS